MTKSRRVPPRTPLPKSAAKRPPADKRGRTSEQNRREIKYHGWHACQALWRKRGPDIIRIYVAKTRLDDAAPMLAWAAKQRLAYHIVGDEELQRVAETNHHQGICVLAREHPRLSFEGFVAESARDANTFAFYVDGIGNPHNTGAIIRTLAFFGGRYLLGAGGAARINLSGSACRVAEGGAEYVSAVDLADPLTQLERLKQLGFTIATTSVENGGDLARYAFPPRTVLILGNEEKGVAADLAALADVPLRVVGAGHIESLNVGVAAGIVAAAYFGQHPPTERR